MKWKCTTEVRCWKGWSSLAAPLPCLPLLKRVIDPDSNSPLLQESHFTKISTFSLVSKNKCALFLGSGSGTCLTGCGLCVYSLGGVSYKLQEEDLAAELFRFLKRVCVFVFTRQHCIVCKLSLWSPAQLLLGLNFYCFSVLRTICCSP